MTFSAYNDNGCTKYKKKHKIDSIKHVTHKS